MANFDRALRTSPYSELCRASDEGNFTTLVLLEKNGDINDCKIMQYDEYGRTEMELYYNDADSAYWDYLQAVVDDDLTMYPSDKLKKTA
jgi:hypothetical protein